MTDHPNIQKLRELSGQLVDPEIAIGIFELFPDAVVVVDGEGAIQLVNRQAELLFDYHRSQLFDRPIEILIPHDARSRHEKHRDEFMRDPRTRPMAHDLPLKGLRRDGSEFVAEINLSPLPTTRGTLVVAVIRKRRDQYAAAAS